jgi:lysylphosphatidylglycerol synthetase-like protein (DUF2156 family)
MTPRAFRRVAALFALASGVSTIVSAATKHPRHAGFLGVEWAASAVIGGRYGLLVCGVALIVLTRGLLHGKRTAQRLALLAALGAAAGHHFRGLDVVALAVIAGLVLVLSLGRHAFRAASDPARARYGWWILVAGETTILIYGVTGLYLLDNEFRRSSTVVDSITAGVRLLFLLPVSTVAPATRHGAFFIDSVRAGSFAVVMAGVIGLVATVVARAEPASGDRRTIEELLDRWATIALAWFFLSDDKNWWFAPDRSAVLAYKVVGSTAVVLGEPVGSPASCRAATSSFLEFCDGNGWTVGFHQVTEEGRAALAECGLRSLKIGESAVVPVTGFDLAGHERKPLRSALRRLERTGYRVVEIAHPIDAATMAALRAVSDAWLSSGGHRERTFTLGRFDPAYLQATTVLALVDSDGGIVAFVNMLPSYRSTAGNFDLMRRLPDAPNGSMDALFAAMIERCRAQGLLGLDLGLAPLANVEENSIAGRTLRAVYERGGSAFNFEGLRAYKQKWDPVWEARYLCYETEADLPKLAAAITRAGELPDQRSPLARMRGFAGRFPVASAITSIVVYVMAATNWDNDLHSQLIRHFGFGWHDLVHLQFWRLVTSPFVQDRPGFVWGNLLLLVPALFLAEHRLRSKSTALIFGLGDGLSTFAVLVIGRLAGALGSQVALRAALQRDGGSSSAGWALIAGCVASLPAGRTRTVTMAGLAGLLGLFAVVSRGEADVEHLVAAMCGAGIVALIARTTGDR